MDIRVDNLQQIQQTTQTQSTPETGEDFKFTLMSSIEDNGLKERSGLVLFG